MASKLFLMLLTCLTVVTSVAAVNALPGCQSTCGDVDVPYPFGIGANCSIAPWANINCNTTLVPPKPFIGNLEVIRFSPDEVRVKNFIATNCYNQSLLDSGYFAFRLGTPYTFSSTKNKLTAIGCDTFVIASGTAGYNYSSGCTSLCDGRQDVTEGICSGSGCCQTSIPRGVNRLLGVVSTIPREVKQRLGVVRVGYKFTRNWTFDACGAAFLAEEAAYTFRFMDYENLTNLRQIPIVLNFGIGNQTCNVARQNATSFACKDNSYCYDSQDDKGYLCGCNAGYAGNPYLDQGCQDVNECEGPNGNPCEGRCTNTIGSYRCLCPDGYYGDGTRNGTGCSKRNKPFPLLQLILGLGFGLLFLIVAGSWLFLVIKKRKLIQLKEKFFQQNGGLLLKQQISSQHGGGAKSTKIFTAEELKLATNNYNQNRILGQGSSGTVYKGVLPDLRIVAIKKSKIVDESQLGQFINELVILTQINHRNVVKLFGCCLETEVPMLVYEFVSNGTLFQYLHKRSGEMPPISWRDRLRIAAEIAGSLSYLHSAASTPIIHRDVKSANILLDNNNTAKMADFGASRLNPMNETQISTLVQGTMGYLDPEYFHTGQLTDKSDVYSFGVVLAELLTGEKPISFERSQTARNLGTYFVSLMKEGHLLQLLEAGIVIQEDNSMEQVNTVAELARRCLSLMGEDRPSMKQVAAELEGLRGFQRQPFIQQSDHEDMGMEYEHGGDLYDPIPLDSSAFPTADSSTPAGSFLKELKLPR